MVHDENTSFTPKTCLALRQLQQWSRACPSVPSYVSRCDSSDWFPFNLTLCNWNVNNRSIKSRVAQPILMTWWAFSLSSLFICLTMGARTQWRIRSTRWPSRSKRTNSHAHSAVLLPPTVRASCFYYAGGSQSTRKASYAVLKSQGIDPLVFYDNWNFNEIGVVEWCCNFISVPMTFQSDCKELFTWCL